MTLQRCMNYLDANKIRYAHTTHFAADTAVEVGARNELLRVNQILLHSSEAMGTR
jgi:hypothetical protein